VARIIALISPSRLRYEVGHRVISRMTKDLVYEESGVNKGVGAPAGQTSQRASK
jgi:hypothetical protein